jgi:hypothetical protein
VALAFSIYAAAAGSVAQTPSSQDVAAKTSFSTDSSDLWWNPNESGWGMQLVQQAEFIFATLFIYGADGKPTWATAQLTPIGTPSWSGPVYVTSGPWFGGTFNPASVTVRQAGSMTFTASSVTAGTVTYSIDGVTVTKQIQLTCPGFPDQS